MSSYPYKQLNFTLFKIGRTFCFMLFVSLCLFLAFQWSFQTFDTRTLFIITLSWFMVFGVAVFITLTRTISPENLNQILNHKAHYESALYGSLATANEQEAAVRTRFYEAYLEHLLAGGGNHKVHFRYLPPEVAKTAHLVCEALIEKERLALAETLRVPTGGELIVRRGNHIKALEVMSAQISAHDSIPRTDGRFIEPKMTGMAMEA